jgi:hypothetical protein
MADRHVHAGPGWLGAVSRTRQAVDDALNGDAEDLHPAAVRALRVLATHIDDLHESIDRAANRIITIGSGIIVTVIAAAITLALRLG